MLLWLYVISKLAYLGIDATICADVGYIFDSVGTVELFDGSSNFWRLHVVSSV